MPIDRTARHQNLSFNMPYVSLTDWPWMFLALNGAIIACRILWNLLAVGTPTDEEEAAPETIPICGFIEAGERIVAAGGLISFS